MHMNATNRILFFCFILISGATLNYNAFSLGESVSNGYMCDPKNPGGEETRLYYRQQNGLAINIAPNATFPVVCPVILPFQEPPYEIYVGLVNTGSSMQKFSCAVEENDANGNTVRTQGNSINIPARTGGYLSWEQMFLLAESNYLSVRCILPPKGAVGFLEWY